MIHEIKEFLWEDDKEIFILMDYSLGKHSNIF